MILASLCVADSPKQQHFAARILNNYQSIFINLSKIKDVWKKKEEIFAITAKVFALNN